MKLKKRNNGENEITTWFSEKIKNAGRPIKVLNLFAYTGGATLAAAAAGAGVLMQFVDVHNLPSLGVLVAFIISLFLRHCQPKRLHWRGKCDKILTLCKNEGFL